MNSLTAISGKTMSSREISELTGKEHKNVTADIRKVFEELEIDALSFQRIYLDGMNREQTEYALNEELTMTLVTGYSIKLRHKVVQRWKELEVRKNTAALPEIMQAAAILLESAQKTLRLSNSSMLGGYQKLQSMAGLPDLMPVYAIDAPAGAADGSSRSTKALRTLLNDAGVKMTAQIAYIRLESAGIVEHKTRPSTTKGEKKFWCITARGLEFGKNMTSPVNPRETQCHWYETKIPELLTIIGGVSK